MSNTRIACSPRPDATPEAELSALANVYKFVLDCRAKKKGARPGTPEDARKDKDAGTCSYST